MVKPDRLAEILGRLAAGEATVDATLERLRGWPVEELGFARIDHHRQLRCGLPEVVFAQGKQPEETVRIAEALARKGPSVLVTRADEETRRRLKERFPSGFCNDRARSFRLELEDREAEGLIVLLAAGTSDLPVAEEAAETARAAGARVETVYDVGVAGLHRLIPHLDILEEANAIVAVAGMEGALPSVVAGLVSTPVIAVPTSVGYGASFGGLAALLGMLNSCASGVVVVNIDNGFGGGFAASQINRQVTAGSAGRAPETGTE